MCHFPVLSFSSPIILKNFFVTRKTDLSIFNRIIFFVFSVFWMIIVFWCFLVLLDLFPQLDHQKRVIEKSMKKQKYPNRYRRSRSRSSSSSRSLSSNSSNLRKGSPERSSRSQFRHTSRSRSRSVNSQKRRKKSFSSSTSSTYSSPCSSPEQGNAEETSV